MKKDFSLLLQLYDRICSKVITPVRAPPSDGLQRLRDTVEILRELQHRRNVDHRDVQELIDLLSRSHLKVGLLIYQIIG